MSSFSVPDILSLTLPISVANGGNNSSVGLAGSSIMVSNGTSVVQGQAGTTTTVLHGMVNGQPEYGPINLDEDDLFGALSMNHGGLGRSLALPGEGQILIGHGSYWDLRHLTAGQNVTIQNGPGSAITINASAGGFAKTEYTTPGTYTYNIPAGARFLDVVMCASGAGGTGSVNSANLHYAGTGGSAAITRFLKIPVDGATTCEVTTAAGGLGQEGGWNINGIANAGGGLSTTITINGKLIVAAHPGTSAGPSASPTPRTGASGGSPGAQIGGNASGLTAGAAGSATPAANTFYTVSVAGLIGRPGVTSGTGSNGTDGGNLLQNYYVLGGTGAVGNVAGSSSQRGGNSQGSFNVGQIAPIPSGNFGWGTGGCGGCSHLGQGGQASTPDSDAQPGQGFGSGGGGAASSNVFRGSRFNGASGAPGYCSIMPM